MAEGDSGNNSENEARDRAGSGGVTPGVGRPACEQRARQQEQGQEAERLEEEKAEQEARAAEEKREAMSKLAHDFEVSVGEVVEAVAATARDLKETAQGVSSIAEQTTTESARVAAAAEESSVNVQTVSSATEEMSASISEMQQQVMRSRDVSPTRLVRMADRRGAANPPRPSSGLEGSSLVWSEGCSITSATHLQDEVDQKPAVIVRGAVPANIRRSIPRRAAQR